MDLKQTCWREALAPGDIVTLDTGATKDRRWPLHTPDCGVAPLGWVHSPIADQNDLAEAVSRFGPVRHFIAPNWLHYARIPDWQSRFPEATTWGSPGVVDPQGAGVCVFSSTVS